LSASLRALHPRIVAGQDFDVVIVSFDPKDTPSDALEKKRKHLEYWKTENTSAAWHLLTGDEAVISQVTRARGSATSTTRSPGSTRTRAASSWSPRRASCRATSTASSTRRRNCGWRWWNQGQGHVGSPIDELLLYCYHYDPETGGTARR
jgi:protein SCO1/2